MTDYDVIIIGSGPAGTACAKKLAENGFSVKVFDKRQKKLDRWASVGCRKS